MNMTLEQFSQTVRPITLSKKNFNKIFCIGYNKTGTTTLEAILKAYGYKLPEQKEQEIRLTKQCFQCNYDELKNFVPMFDAFQDLPFSQGEMYAVADALFPNSKFILSERNAESWFTSLTGFHKKKFGLSTLEKITEQDILEKFNYLYPGYIHENQKRLLTFFKEDEPETNWSLLYNKDLYINEYNNRNQRIKKYFQNCPEKLLVIDLSKESDTRKICEFLNIPKQYIINMPRLNKS